MFWGVFNIVIIDDVFKVVVFFLLIFVLFVVVFYCVWFVEVVLGFNKMYSLY